MRSKSALLRNAACAALLAVASLAVAHPARASGEVNIYSYREPGLINPLLAAFTKETGIKTNVVFATNGLIERLAAEGKNSPADLLLTNEFGLLLQAVAAGVTQPVHSEIIDKTIPADLRDDGPVVRPDAARPRRLCLEGPRQAGRDHLRRARRPQVARQDLHPLRPAHLQRCARRFDDRPQRRGSDREVARRTKGQSGAAPAGGDREGVRDVQAGLCDSPSAIPITWRRC